MCVCVCVCVCVLEDVLLCLCNAPFGLSVMSIIAIFE